MLSVQTRYFLSCILFFALSACASYEAQTLLDPATNQPASKDALQYLTVDAASMPFPVLAAHRFDASDGLDSTEMAMLAVVNNPDLQLARDDAAVAHAQAFSAGLLPDPQLSISHDVGNAGAASMQAYAFGLSYDVNTLILHSSLQNMLASESRKTNLNLLWQEWQVIAQVRLVFIKLIQAKKSMSILDATQQLFVERLQRTQNALDHGLLTSEAVTPNLVALQDVQRQIFELKRQSNQNSHDLNALLGLAPGTELRLQENTDPEQLDARTLPARASGRANLARRRPDLLALEAGYQAQDQRYRGALLAQFPALNIGLTHARDASSIASSAFGITLTVPVWNRNRGNIAIEKVTRQRLFDEYQQRLQASNNGIERILSEQKLNLNQQREMDAAIVTLRSALARSESAFHANSIDALLYCSAQAALLAKQLERISLQQAIQEQDVALQTLLGVDLFVRSSNSPH